MSAPAPPTTDVTGKLLIGQLVNEDGYGLDGAVAYSDISALTSVGLCMFDSGVIGGVQISLAGGQVLNMAGDYASILALWQATL